MLAEVTLLVSTTAGTVEFDKSTGATVAEGSIAEDVELELSMLAFGSTGVEVFEVSMTALGSTEVKVELLVSKVELLLPPSTGAAVAPAPLTSVVLSVLGMLPVVSSRTAGIPVGVAIIPVEMRENPI